jgi:hypothetical protein
VSSFSGSRGRLKRAISSTPSIPTTRPGSRAQAEQDEAALRERVRELIDEERELYDALA